MWILCDTFWVIFLFQLFLNCVFMLLNDYITDFNLWSIIQYYCDSIHYHEYSSINYCDNKSFIFAWPYCHGNI